MDDSIRIGPFGGVGGDDYDFKAIHGIRKIRIQHGGIIFSVEFSTVDDNNIPVTSRMIGGEHTGSRFDKIKIQWPNEYLTSITWYQGGPGMKPGYPCIRSLRFHTNKNEYGPYGSEQQGTKFSLSMKGGAIVGFHGTSGTVLDSIGVYLKPILSLSQTEVITKQSSQVLRVISEVPPDGVNPCNPRDDGVFTGIKGIYVEKAKALIQPLLVQDKKNNLLENIATTLDRCFEELRQPFIDYFGIECSYQRKDS
ncbi:hypothetical protein GIB67_029103 [Kingdonia uniflora]|uniref:Jacalin-type lectin domain-containing protein n=1 Tax=Kingdonia uniflora TaxID=39325 RepID=A0A7J7N729_9MAGN|nr:hypothetical protein GIB67_029103 [Kingdonia uniflora]